jgi:hypothetical protein
MRKLGILIAFVMVALSTLGMGYAYWVQNLNINGTVNTGNLSAKFINVTSTTSLYTTCITGVSSDGKSLNITIGGAYPGCSTTIFFTINNDGTIPVKISTGSLVIIPPVGGAASDISVSTSFPTGTINAPPNSVHSAAGSLTVSIPGSKNPPMNASYGISIPMIVYQFNGYTPTP